MSAANDPSTPAPASGRVSKIPRERIDHAIELWLTGRPPVALQNELAERFGVTQRAARRYIQIARERLEKDAPPQPGAARARAEQMLLQAFEIAFKAGDAKTMGWLAERLGKLDGLFNEKFEITGKNGAPLVPVNIQLRWPDEHNDPTPPAPPEAT